jgi:hypothetical protein
MDSGFNFFGFDRIYRIIFYSPEAIEIFGFHLESQKKYPINPVNPV